MIDAHTTTFPIRPPNLFSMYREENDSGICAIIPINAHILNVLNGTLT